MGAGRGLLGNDRQGVGWRCFKMRLPCIAVFQACNIVKKRQTFAKHGLEVGMAVESRKSSGFWYARFMVNGKRVCVPLESRVTGVPGSAEYEASRRAAQAEERRLRGAGVRGDAAYHRRLAEALTPAADPTAGIRQVRLDRLAGKWIGRDRARGLSKEWQTQIRAYCRHFSDWMAGHGAETMDSVSPDLAQRYMRAVAGRGVTGATFNNVLALLAGIFGAFGEDAEVERNPFARIRKARKETVSRVPYTKAELDRLLTCCPPEIAGAVATAACTGMRRGDACRLEWKHVDLDGGFLRDVQVRKTGAVVDVPILPLLRRYLEAAGGSRGRYVWPDAARLANESPNSLNGRLNKALSAAGVEGKAARSGIGRRRANVRGWHSLKTTFITEALNNGMPVPMLRKIVGNSTVDVVMKHYYQPDKARMAEEMRRALGAWGA